MILYYVRHGDPIYEPDSLTELGHKQAEALAARLANADIDRLFASTSTRARQTAAPTAKLLGKDVTLLDWCNERYAWKEFSIVRKGVRKWLFQEDEYLHKFVSCEFEKLGDKWYKHPDVYTETLEKGIARIKLATYAFLSDLGYDKAEDGNYFVANRDNNERIALFAHEGFGMAFLSTVMGIPYSTFCSRFELEHSCVTVVRFEGDDIVFPRILQLNNDSHLFKAGLPTNFNNGVKV